MKYKDPILGDEYNDFVRLMIECAKNNRLPQLMEINDTSKIKLSDIHNLITRFTNDTGLIMKLSAEICTNCSRLHVFLFVDYPDDEDCGPLN